ncbi:MAG: hypothetical protein GC186_16460 [Rhodobacteraceae bacterium]|nr:hypothetical protein [Paracoccaceae bacterium]
MASETYRRQRHVGAVVAGSGTRHSTRLVLEILCRLSEFDRPEVTTTKPQLVEESGLYRDTVYAAIRELREAGIILPVRNAKGGRGNAVTYRLLARGAELTPSTTTADPAPAGLWDSVSRGYKAAQPALWRAWVAKLACASDTGGALSLTAPTAFAAEYCRTHLAAPLLELARGADPSIRRIDFAAAN